VELIDRGGPLHVLSYIEFFHFMERVSSFRAKALSFVSHFFFGLVRTIFLLLCNSDLDGHSF
jgi:hypothetical protein